MKRLIAAALTLLGIGLVLFGLLFMVGAGGRAHRYLIAVVSLAMGGALAGLGVRMFRQADSSSPEQLRADILELARREDGEVSEADVMAALGRRSIGAPAVLEAMVGEGLCERTRKQGATYYLFRQLQPRLLVRRCEYCNAELPLEQQITECPNCGGTLKTQVETRSLAGDHYSMDE